MAGICDIGFEKLKDFVLNNDVEYTFGPPEPEQVEAVKGHLNMELGAQLRTYLLEYGYLEYRRAEFYGLTAFMGLDSDLVQQTESLHRHWPETRAYFALESFKEGGYALLDSDDRVYFLSCSIGAITPAGKDLYEYLLVRLAEENG